MRRGTGGRHLEHAQPRHRHARSHRPQAAHAPRRDRQRSRDRRRRRAARAHPRQLLPQDVREHQVRSPSASRRLRRGDDLRRRGRGRDDRERCPGQFSPRHRLARRPRQPRRDRSRRTLRDAAHPAAVRRPRERRPPRADALRRAARDREGNQGRLHLLVLLAHNRVQGAPPRHADREVLPRPLRSRVRVAVRPRAPALLHEHLPHLAARPPLPRPRAQRRDQRAQGQPQCPLRARALARLAGLRRRPQAPAAARDARPVGLRLARQHVRAARRRRTRRAARDDDAHPSGLGREVPHGPRRPRLLRVPLRAHGAVGRPRRRRVHRRHRRRRDARPQRSPPSPLDAHQGRPVRPRLRGRRARPPSSGHRPPRTPPPRSDRLARPREAPPPRRHRAQDLLRAPPPVPPLGGAEPHLDPGPLQT